MKKFLFSVLTSVVLVGIVGHGTVCAFDPKITYVSVAEEYMRNKGYPVYAIPAKLRLEYNTRLENARLAINAKLIREGRNTLELYEFESLIYYELDPFIRTLRDANIQSSVADAGQQFLRDKGLYLSSLTWSQHNEYDDLIASAVHNVQLIEYQNGNNYVSKSDIETEVRKMLASFVCNILDHQEAVAQSCWDSFWGGSNTVSVPYSVISGQKCPICLNFYYVNDQVGYLQCNHHFHEGCIRQRLATDYVHKSCPLCGLDNRYVVRVETIR